MPDDKEPAPQGENDNTIELSQVTDALLDSLKKIKDRTPADDFTKLQVSQAVSFLALVYERVRNAIEYREEHLIRRAAIERIIKRRLAMNPQGTGEAENLLRELMWARYFPNGSLGENDISEVQHIIDIYLSIKKKLLTGRNHELQVYLSQFLFDLMTCEIEEVLSPEYAAREANFNYFIYQTIKDKVKIEEMNTQQKDAFVLIALERSYRKSDMSYQRYHLLTVFYQPLRNYKKEELQDLSTKLPEVFQKVDNLIKNPVVEKLTKFTRKQLPPYLILFETIRNKPKEIEQILRNKARLWSEVDLTCRNRYQTIKSKLNLLAVRSLIYIFITKMIFAIILEVPLSKLIYNEINYTAIAINGLFPPLLMLIIILTIRLPGEDNTKRIFSRIVDIINHDPTFEQRVALITKKPRQRRPILNLGFTVFYTLTFVITLFVIYDLLSIISFNLLSMSLFIFFISVVSFFSYRIKQVVNEYRLIEKDSLLRPVIDFFMMPIVSLGKLFSEGVSKINVFTVLFDFIIEAPFKLIIEVIEEWMSFVRQRKEEIM